MPVYICALLLDDKNPKLCDICKNHIGEICEIAVIVIHAFLIDSFQFICPGLHKKRYFESLINPGSYCGGISYESSIFQDIILDVPNPISSSMTVVISSSHGFDVP